MRTNGPSDHHTAAATVAVMRQGAERWAANPDKLRRCLRAVLQAHEDGRINLHGDLGELEAFAYQLDRKEAAA